MTYFQALAGLSLLAILPSIATDDPCEATADLQLAATRLELREDLFASVGACINLADPDERERCLRQARFDYADGLALAQEQYDARISLCELLGGGRYDPVIDPDDFVDEIDNPYLPYPVGASWTYESLTDEGLETIEVTVLAETREILGVECVTVRDVVSLEGEPVEDTFDWFAQDVHGNVWYFGEISFSFEDGFVENIDGSWLAGVDGAKPGIVMMATPTPGTTYRQEWWLGEAEDAATVLDDDVDVTIGLGTFMSCVQTADFLPPEPDALEHKFYAPGLGFIHEVKVGSPETVELISFSGL